MRRSKFRNLAASFVVDLGLFAIMAGSASAQMLEIGVIVQLTGGSAPWSLTAGQGAEDSRGGN
jgi:hypothetical protein